MARRRCRPAWRRDCPLVSGGDVFPGLAEEQDTTLTQPSAEAQETDEIDGALDRHLREVGRALGRGRRPLRATLEQSDAGADEGASETPPVDNEAGSAGLRPRTPG